MNDCEYNLEYNKLVKSDFPDQIERLQVFRENLVHLIRKERKKKCFELILQQLQRPLRSSNAVIFNGACLHSIVRKKQTVWI